MKNAYNLTCVLALSLLLSACGGAGTASREELSDLQPYVESSPYADRLTDCAMANVAWSSCTVASLPPLAMEHPEPTIEDVMSRVVVSHPWMGLRFEQLLHKLPKDMLYLFGSVTAVVIDDDIRPSYYWSLTGAIYLDPASLWLTFEEKDSINRKQDHRTGNESEMRFRFYARQAINGADASRHYGLDSEIERPLDDIVIPMANLLFHELAHAIDQFPRAFYEDVNVNRRIAYVTEGVKSSTPSSILKRELPLQSQQLFSMANILYRGHTPTEEQTFWTANELGLAFAEDGANDSYGYASQFEDLAMLFEETMMHLYFGTEREIAFIEAPEQKYPPCGEAIIAWGARNRIGDPWVKERIKLILENLLPDRDYSDRINAIPEPTLLTPGTDWCAMVDEQRNLANSASTNQPTAEVLLQAAPQHRHAFH